MGRGGLAARVRRPGGGTARALHRPRGAGPGPGSRDGGAHRSQPGRPHPPGPRDRRAEEAVAVEDPHGRGAVVPTVQRAGGRQRPGRSGHPGRPGGRGLAGQRPEGLDVLRPVRRLGGVPGPNRPRSTQAQGDLLSGGGHAPSRSRRPAPGPAHRRGRVQRGVPDRCLRPRGPADRSRARRVAGGQLHPVARTGHQPPPAGDPHAAPRGALPAGRGERDIAGQEGGRGPGPGLRGDPPVPAAQPPQREPTGAGTRPGARGQCPQAVLERDVQALPGDGAGRGG